MATAVEPSSTPSTPQQSLQLPIASFLGAIYTLAVLAIVFYVLPTVWRGYITPIVPSNVVDWIFWFPSWLAVVLGLVWFGLKLVGDNAPRGLSGGIFLMLVFGAVIFLTVRFFALNFDGVPGMAIGGALGVVLLYFAFRFFTGERGERWMVALEDQGWFSTHQYKRSLGVRVRRLTIMGILIIGGTGAYTVYNLGTLPDSWTMQMPDGLPQITLIKSAHISIPAVLLAITAWFAFRVVNIPTFAEFLIATEAEMNKVSWSNRRRLTQDTIVVLITTLIMAIFLLIVDLFWGWLLSRQTVGVLPSRATGQDEKQVLEAKW